MADDRGQGGPTGRRSANLTNIGTGAAALGYDWRMARQRSALIALSAAILLSTWIVPRTIATAQMPATADADPARDLFQQGVDAFDAGRYQDALGLFRQSYDARAAQLVLYNIAITERQLGHNAAALRHFETYLAGTLDEQRRAQVQAEIAALEATVARVEMRVTPVGARVSLDDEEIGTAPLPAPVAVDPGNHRVSATARGYGRSERPLSVRAGDRTQLEVVLSPEESAGPDLASVPPDEADDSAQTSLTLGADDPSRDEDSGGLLSSPIFWVAAGAVVVGAVVATILIAGQEPETVEGNYPPGQPVIYALTWP